MDRIHIHLDLQPASGTLQKFFRQEMEGPALRSPEKHLPAVTSPETDEGGFGGADDVRLSAGNGRGQLRARFPISATAFFPSAFFGQEKWRPMRREKGG